MKFWCQLLKKMTTWLLTIDWNQKKKTNKTDCTFLCVLGRFCVCWEDTNCSLNCMEGQLSLMSMLFLHLGAAVELQSSAQKDNLRPSLETSALADLFLRPVFLHRIWISWFSANLMTVPRDNSSPIQSKPAQLSIRSHDFYVWGQKGGSSP